MYAARCPQCGKPGPVVLATPDRFSCDACGYAGALPAELTDELRRAAHVITAHDARERQLTRFQRRMAISTGFSTAVYLASLGFALSPFGCCLAYFLIARTGPFDWGAFLLGLLPIVIVGVFGASGYGFVQKRLRRVRELVAALPPRAPGQPARCHLCGGDVAAIEGEAFARCGYCHTDNLTDPAVLARLARSRELVLEGHEARATERSLIARQAFRSAMRGLLAGTILAAPISCVCTTPVLFAMWQIETDPYPTLEYTAVQTSRGVCLATVVANPVEDGQVVLNERWGGGDGLALYRLESQVPTFLYPELIGLRAQELVAGHGEMTVVSVFGTAGTGDNRVNLRASDGFERQDWPQSLCLVDAAQSPVDPVPLHVPAP